MSVYDDFYSEIRSKASIADEVSKKVALTKKGKEFLGLCPFHGEKTPSFTVNEYKQFYHCFGCGAHGDVIRFYAEINGYSYFQSASLIAKSYGIKIPELSKEEKDKEDLKDQIVGVMELAKNYFVNNLQSNDHAKQYLKQRGILDSTIKLYGIGFAPQFGLFKTLIKHAPLSLLLEAGLVAVNDKGDVYDFFRNRIIIPISDQYGKIIAFGGRVITDELPKYINSKESAAFNKSNTIFNEHLAIADAYKKDEIIFTEGYLDVIALNQAGIKNAVACLGTAVNVSHIQKVWKYSKEIIVCLDGDAAGIKAMNRIIDIAIPYISAFKTLSFVVLEEGHDPDSLIKSKGQEGFVNAVKKKMNLSLAIWHFMTFNKTIKTPEDLSKIKHSLFSYVNNISDKTLAKFYTDYFLYQLNALKNQLFPYQQPIKFTKKSYKHDGDNLYNAKTKATCVNLTLNLDTNSTENNHMVYDFYEELLCYVIINYPQYITDILKDEIYNLELCNKEIKLLSYVLIDNLDILNKKDLDQLHAILNSNNVYDLYLKYCNDINLINSKEKFLIIINYLIKRNKLISLKKMYSCSLGVESYNNNTSSLLREILETEQELTSMHTDIMA
jgi:DNA primase